MLLRQITYLESAYRPGTEAEHCLSLSNQAEGLPVRKNVSLVQVATIS